LNPADLVSGIAAEQNVLPNAIGAIVEALISKPIINKRCRPVSVKVHPPVVIHRFGPD
jgi:hypothetical protein